MFWVSGLVLRVLRGSKFTVCGRGPASLEMCFAFRMSVSGSRVEQNSLRASRLVVLVSRIRVRDPRSNTMSVSGRRGHLRVQGYEFYKVVAQGLWRSYTPHSNPRSPWFRVSRVGCRVQGATKLVGQTSPRWPDLIIRTFQVCWSDLIIRLRVNFAKCRTRAFSERRSRFQKHLPQECGFEN